MLEKAVKVSTAFLMLMAFGLTSMPAVARHQGPNLAGHQRRGCVDRFIVADLDNDGVLSDWEIGSAGANVPPSLANKSQITRPEFLAACSGAKS